MRVWGAVLAVVAVVVAIGSCGKDSTGPQTIAVPLVVLSVDSVSAVGGQTVDVAVRLTYPYPPEDTLEKLGGFDFRVHYDTTALQLRGVERGPGISYWEYFTYRKESDSEADFLRHNIRIVGIYDMNNGINPGQSQVYPGGVIATLKFLRAAGQRPDEVCASIGFSLSECGDNVLWSLSGNDIYLPRTAADGVKILEDNYTVSCSTWIEIPNHPRVHAGVVELQAGKVCIEPSGIRPCDMNFDDIIWR